MARLVLESGPEAGIVYPIGQNALTIGRGAHCDISVTDRRVSREHARVRCHRGGYVLEDLESRNGTFLNHQPMIGLLRLNDGDRVAVGGTVFIFELDNTDSQIQKSNYDRVRLESTASRASQVEAPVNWDVTPMDGISALSREMLRDPLQRLRAIYTVSDSLRNEHDIHDLLWKIIEIIWAVIKPDRGVILITDDNDGGELIPALVKTSIDTQEEVIISQGMVRRSMSEKVAILMADAPSDERFGDSQSVFAGQIRSAICAPLVTGGKSLGVLYIDLQHSHLSKSPAFTRDDLDLITGISLQAAMAIQNARLHEEMNKHQRLEKELEIAREIQTSMLPRQYPLLKGVQFATICLPARQVGGDYFDFLEMPDKRTAIVVGDASGKGVPAAIMVSMVRAGLRAQIRTTPQKSVGLIVKALNHAVCVDGSRDDLATLLMMIYDERNQTIQYSNAGHVPGLLIKSSGQVVRMDDGGLLLGVTEEVSYVETELKIGSGDVIVLYTDGVTETSNLAGQMFGEDRLTELAVRYRTSAAEDIRDVIYQNVVRFRESNEQYDDLTVVVVKFN